VRKSSTLQFALAAFVIFLSHAAPAQAQSGTFAVVWVASYGTENTSCQTANPCATFDQAIAAVAPSGLIMCLNGGAYNFTTPITHPLTIDCTNTVAYTRHITVQLGFASDVVILKGLTMDAFNFSGTTAGSDHEFIRFTGSGRLQLEDIKISKVLGSVWNGVLFQPAGRATLIMTNCDITNIGSGGTTAGVYIQPTSGVQVTFAIEHSRINNNIFGIIADGTAGGTIRGIVSDSFVIGNANNGITAASAGTNVTLTVDNTKVSGNNFGLVATGTNAGMLVRRSVVNSNATGLFTASSGVILSYRDNSLNGNTTTDGVFTGPVGLQ
jgi:hypothetical protein